MIVIVCIYERKQPPKQKRSHLSKKCKFPKNAQAAKPLDSPLQLELHKLLLFLQNDVFMNIHVSLLEISVEHSFQASTKQNTTAQRCHCRGRTTNKKKPSTSCIIINNNKNDKDMIN